MKYLILIIFSILCSCENINDYYHGNVTDEKGRVLADVKVSELYRNNHTKTDANGYFKLSRSPDWLGELILYKSGFETDTIPSVWHQAGETTEYRFVKNDTALVRLQNSVAK